MNSLLRTLKHSRISEGLNSQIIGNQIFGFLQNSLYDIFFYKIIATPLSESFFFLWACLCKLSGDGGFETSKTTTKRHRSLSIIRETLQLCFLTSYKHSKSRALRTESPRPFFHTFIPYLVCRLRVDESDPPSLMQSFGEGGGCGGWGGGLGAWPHGGAGGGRIFCFFV